MKKLSSTASAHTDLLLRGASCALALLAAHTASATLTIQTTPIIGGVITNLAGDELWLCANNTNSTLNNAGITKTFTSQKLGPVNNTGSIRIATAPTNWGRTIDTTALNMSGTAVLDVTNNAMVIRGGNLANINALLLAGCNGYLWNGPGINSSCAEAQGASLLGAVGVILNNTDFAFTSFSDVTGLALNDIIVAYTLPGDADLDGAITANDYALLALGISAQRPALWQYGDFDYDGQITPIDQFLIDNSFAGQGSQLICPPEFCVPEPGSTGLLLAAAIGLLSGRRRSK